MCVLGRQLLLKAVNRVWTELMHSKRQMLEDIFKVSLPVNDRGHVDIATARPALEEPAAKSWQSHLGEENVRSAYFFLDLLCVSLTVLNNFCFPSSPWEEMHQQGWDCCPSESVQTVSSQQWLWSVQTDRLPSQQEGKWNEQEQPFCTGSWLNNFHKCGNELIFRTCAGSLYSHLVLTVHRKPSSGCSRTLLSFGTW